MGLRNTTNMRMIKIVTALAAFGYLTAFMPKAISQELPEWVKTFKISGDFGARTEYINDMKATDNYDRVRERVRFRLSLDVSPANRIKASFGLETTGTNPTAAWADLTDFRKQPLYVAHAYVQYDASEQLTVSGGILKNEIPFWKPVQLVWKSEVNPYGIAANARVNIRKNLDFFLNGGLFALTEYRDNQLGIDNPMNAIAVVQPGIEYGKGKLRTKSAFSIQQFSLENHDTSANTWVRANESFTLITPAWEVNYLNIVGPYGPMFAGEYSKNIHDNAGSATQAYLIQAGFGDERIDRFKAWQVKAAYRRRELYAIPYGFGQTNAYDADAGKGWEYFVAFGLLKNLAFNATIYDMTDLDGNLPQKVSQFDVIFRF